ncbi:MAG: hypothetical protein RL235_816 [Chlamydiota bacterium]|jgi:hypothetical protein
MFYYNIRNSKIDAKLTIRMQKMTSNITLAGAVTFVSNAIDIYRAQYKRDWIGTVLAINNCALSLAAFQIPSEQSPSRELTRNALFTGACFGKAILLRRQGYAWNSTPVVLGTALGVLGGITTVASLTMMSNFASLPQLRA